jgi:MSHA biogenesis protein MshP
MSRSFHVPSRQRGVGIVMAVFLLVVLAALAIMLVMFTNAQSASSGLDVQGARAYQAARAGIEYGLYRYNVDSECTTTNLAPAATTMQSFTVTVSCTVTSASPKLVSIVATACNVPSGGSCPAVGSNPGNAPDLVRRQVEVQLEGP